MFELKITTASAAEMREYAEALFGSLTSRPPAQEPEPDLAPQQPHPILADAAADKPKAKRGRPPRVKVESVPDSTDPAQTTLAPAAPVTNAADLPTPTMEELKALIEDYQHQKGLAALRTKLVEAGVNRITELGDKLPAFYAARRAELSA